MKIDLRDTTFLIPVHFDHKDRKDNLELLISLLQQNFETNIIVGEQGGNHFEYVSRWVKYVNFDYENFHRTKMLNELANLADTPIVVNQDADCLIAPAQMWRAVELIRTNNADFSYPYEYLFVRVPKHKHKLIFPSYDLSVFAKEMTGADSKTRPSVGGVVVYDKRKFQEVGGENENFLSYSPEDVERYERFTRLGLKCKRVRGHLYHLDHHVGVNSSTANPFYEQGQKELEKVRKMTNDELREYVLSWPWYRGYTDGYRLEISPTAEQSAKEIYEVLIEDFDLFHGGFIGSIIDFGCGVGSFGVGQKNYTGVDFKVPREMLKVENYIEHDLRQPYISDKKYALVISTEVAEHLEEKYANTFVDTLCNAAKEYILFSAAIPNQGGLNHFNEKPQSYWAEKFAKRGYFPYFKDIREVLYDNEKVDLWYRNNLVLYCKDLNVATYHIDFVHPKYYLEITNHLKG